MNFDKDGNLYDANTKCMNCGELLTSARHECYSEKNSLSDETCMYCGNAFSFPNIHYCHVQANMDASSVEKSLISEVHKRQDVILGMLLTLNRKINQLVDRD